MMNPFAAEHKVALLLSSLDSQAADDVIQQLSQERKNRIRGLMRQRANEVPPAELLDRLVRDLVAKAARPVTHDGASAIRLVTPDAPNETVGHESRIASSQSSEGRNSVGPDARGDAANASEPMAQLRAMDLDRLLAGLEGEHPQSVATVINCLEPQAAGEVLKRLPPDVRRMVFLRLSQTTNSPLDLVPRIIQAIVQKCNTLADSPLTEKGDTKYQKMAEVLKRLERTDRAELLEALTQQDSAAAALVKDRLYVFEDLRVIEDRSVQKLLAEVDSKTLAIALKETTDDIKEKVLNNLSKRGREMVAEEIGFLGHIPATQIQQAQKAVVDVIQRLDQAGDLVMMQEA